MLKRVQNIATSSGRMPTHVLHPDGRSPAPVIIFYMDALGLRAELVQMASQMCAAGYYVLLPNLFYRAGGPSFDPSTLPDYVDPKMERLNVETTMAMVAEDTRALVTFAIADELARDDSIGVIGYCMGGRHAITAAATFPDRVKAAASIHGGRLVSEAADSAHRRLADVKAEVFFAFADQDPAAPEVHLEMIRRQIVLHGLSGQARLLHGALHGFAFPERFCHHEQMAEYCRATWYDMLERNLGSSAVVGRAPDSAWPRGER